MDAQRPWPHFVQLNGLPDQMPEVAKDRERLEVSLPSSKCFADAHVIELQMGRELGKAIVGLYHYSWHNPPSSRAFYTYAIC